ncbi:hypothetical protein ACWC5I_08795 [Kitasatospora sp. NPDC001574]
MDSAPTGAGFATPNGPDANRRPGTASLRGDISMRNTPTERPPGPMPPDADTNTDSE